MSTPQDNLDSVELQPRSSVRRRYIRILAIEDDSFDEAGLRRCLRRIDDWSHGWTPCSTVAEARDVVADAEFDLVFLDECLSGDSGLDALHKLRAAGLQAPVILLSDSCSEEALLDARQAGAADCVPKSKLSPAVLRRAANNAIEKAELARAVRQKQLNIERIEGRQAELESFYHHASHELKTPLTGARELISLVLDGAAGSLSLEQARLLAVALRNCDRMTACMDDMLDVSRLDTGKLTLKTRVVDVLGLVQDVCESLRRRAFDAAVELEIVAPRSPVVGTLDPQRIYQVVANLVSNAIKFSKRDGRVTVELECAPEETVSISVTDRGRGISPARRARVFDRLYQSEQEDASALGGLGLGLYISKQIVALHGGEIELRSEAGEGTCVRFTLPNLARQAGLQPAT